MPILVNCTFAICKTVREQIRLLGTISSRKNSGSHIDASLSRQPLVKGERLVRYEVNAVMLDLTRSDENVLERGDGLMFVHGLSVAST